MTVAFKLGRVAEGIPATGEVTSWSSSGPAVTAAVEYVTGTPTDAAAIVAQLLGLVEHGLPLQVVPLVWGESSGRDGFYRVESVDLDLDRRWLRSHAVRASLGLTRIAGGSGLAGEHILWGADREATPSSGDWVTDTPIPWVAWPSTWGTTIDLTGAGVTEPVLARRVTADPLVEMQVVSHLPYNTSVLTAPSPGAFYDGACRVRTGNPLHYVTGRHETIDPGAFEISNGLVKITPPTSTSGRVFEFQYRDWSGQSWGSRLRTLSLWLDNTYSAVTWDMRPVAIAVIRNSPEMVVVRMTCPTEYPNGVVYLDVGLRRGSRFMTISLTAAVELQWAIGHGTGFNGSWGGISSPAVGAQQTSADSDGHLPFILLGSVQETGIAFTSSGRVTNGGTYRSIEVAIGAEVTTAFAPTYDQTEIIERQYFAAQGETFRVVQQ